MLVYFGYHELECTNLTAEVEEGDSPVELLWSTGETSNTIEVCPEETTSYTVIGKDESGCTALELVDVCVENVICKNPELERVSVCFQYAVNGTVLIQLNLCMSQQGAANWLPLEHPRYTFSLGLCESETCLPYKSSGGKGNSEIETIDIDSEAQLLQLLAELSSEMSIYPNPASDILNIEFETFEELKQVNISIYDALGHLVNQRYLGTISEDSYTKEVLDISKYETGIYLIQITSNQLPIGTKRLSVIR